MRRMNRTLGVFRAALLVGWIALSAAGWLLAREKGIPGWAAWPVIAAFLVEYPFYLVAGFPALRDRLATPLLPWLLAISAALPYLVSSIGTSTFSWVSLARLVALALVLSLWYVLLPARPITDYGFLGVIAAVLLGKYFTKVYTAPYPGVEIATLGHLALIHISVIVLLVERRTDEGGFGFIPNRAEWKIGAMHYLAFLPVGFPLAFALNAMRFGPMPSAWRLVATFLGFLWVVALSEEFFFRGALQHWIEEQTWRPQLALIITSVLFGLVHLPFRGFPNWRWVLLASILGYFCGRARNEARSVRAAMVTHALVITTWRALFA
jgi:uncharacterized protein